MIVAIFISQDGLDFDSVIENPKILVSLPKKTLFLTHVQPGSMKGALGRWRDAALHPCSCSSLTEQLLSETLLVTKIGERVLWMVSQLNDGPRSDTSHFPSLARTSFIATPNPKVTRKCNSTTYPKKQVERWTTW